MTIDEMYLLRKRTKGVRRGWGYRPAKNIEADSNTHPGIGSKIRLRMCVNLFSLAFILAVVVATIGLL